MAEYQGQSRSPASWTGAGAEARPPGSHCQEGLHLLALVYSLVRGARSLLLQGDVLRVKVKAWVTLGTDERGPPLALLDAGVERVW